MIKNKAYADILTFYLSVKFGNDYRVVIYSLQCPRPLCLYVKANESCIRMEMCHVSYKVGFVLAGFCDATTQDITYSAKDGFESLKTYRE